ncbi:MAG: hypothetical protein KDN19_02425 [Verrucomicrobiae bacterium]|nr:hypothetical protein [Verrucomicrobiae bacterium]
MPDSFPTKLLTNSIILAVLGLCSPAGAQELLDSTTAKRLIPATAAPEGSLEISVATEYATLNFDYSRFNDAGDLFEFRAHEFHTWTTDIEIVFGLLEDLELTATLPLVRANFEAADKDTISRRRERSEFGIGDVEIAASYGFESEDETLLALVSLGAELPTNTLGSFFGGGTSAGIGVVEVEKYFGGFGWVCGIETHLEDRDWTHEFRAGVALVPTRDLFWQAIFARNPSEGIDRIETNLEYLVSEELSLECLFSQEISGKERETIVGIGVTFFFESAGEDD